MDLATLAADWAALSQPARVLLSALAVLALLLLVGWLTARRTARTSRNEGRTLRQEAERARQDHALAMDRLAAREARQAELANELATARDSQRAAETARADLSATAERRQEAVERLERLERELRADLVTARETLDGLRTEHGQLKSDHAAMIADRDEKLASADREVTALKELREEMSRRFEEVANATLRRTGADFQKSHTERLTTLLTPFREQVNRFETELREVHGKADQERARMGEQIRMLTEQSQKIGEEAVNLTRALKGDKQKQGAWGEMILERILEASGLERDTHYAVQQHRRDEEGGRWRPDVVVKMPRGKSLVIDSKVSLVAYEAATGAETDEDRARHLKDHVTSVRRHIDQLAEKGYHAMEDGSVDYVLMFMPIEGALAAALSEEGDLTAYAVARGVGVMTPTTLMVTLRTVDHIWTVERRESNAEEIAKRAGLLYDKVAGFVSNLESVGTHLDRAVRAHGDALGQLSTGNGNVLGQVDKLKRMGARTSKALAVPFEAAEEDDGDDTQDRALLPGEAAE